MQYHVSVVTYADGSRNVTLCPQSISGHSHSPKKPIEISPFDGKPIYKQLFDYSPEERAYLDEKSKKDAVRRAEKKVRAISRCNKWDYFLTLTFNPEKVNSYDYSSCVQAIHKWLDVQRKKNPDMKYIVVFEPHKSGRYHVHGLFANVEWRMKRASFKGNSSRGCTIFNLLDGDYRFGYSTVSAIRSSGAAASYVAKYIAKSLDFIPVGCKRYWASRNLTTLDDVTERYIFPDPDELQAFQFQLEISCDCSRQVFCRESGKYIYYYDFFGKGVFHDN